MICATICPAFAWTLKDNFGICWLFNLRTKMLLSLIFQSFVIIFFSLSGENSTRYTHWKHWIIAIAQYIYCILLVRGSKQVYSILHERFWEQKPLDYCNVFISNFKHLVLFSVAIQVLLYTEQYLVGDQLVVIFVAITLLDKIESSVDIKSMLGPKTISYGTGIACSFFEGYLNLVLPNNGGDNAGIDKKIVAYEDANHVRFPVRKLLLIITKSLFCPPDLVDFNKEHRPDLAWLEASTSIEEVKRNVAGVRNRSYRNSVYKIHRPGPHKRRPVSVLAECATPLHTLYKAMHNRTLYPDLGDINTEVVVEEFCTSLQSILDRSPECRGKCELIFYDDTDPEQNLADILLARIAVLQKNYEEIIEQTK